LACAPSWAFSDGGVERLLSVGEEEPHVWFWSGNPGEMSAVASVLLLPVDHPSREDLENLASDLSAMGLPCTVDRAVPLPQDAYDRRRNQYLANALLGLAARAAHALANLCARVLAVTEADLYAADLNFVFGIAQSRGPAAVISLCRLGLGADPPLRRERALKEAVHELGHTLGLNHCPDAKCVMHFSNSLADTDRKESVLCPVCQRRGGIHRVQLST
jgi:archaemetzincin